MGAIEFFIDHETTTTMTLHMTLLKLISPFSKGCFIRHHDFVVNASQVLAPSFLILWKRMFQKVQTGDPSNLWNAAMNGWHGVPLPLYTQRPEP